MCKSGNITQTEGAKVKTEFTLEQLRAHNTPKSAWAAIHGKVLDITAFAERHPGGDIILLAAGRDATVLFETYHPCGVPNAVVEKLQIGVMKKGEVQSSFYSWNSDFYRTLKIRVTAHLAQRQISRRGSYEIYIKALFLLLGFWTSLVLMYRSASLGSAILWSISMGIFAAFIGTCIQHDGNHGAFSKSRFWNKMAGWTLDMIGASAFTWEFQHMLGHHPYTNLLHTTNNDESKDQESDPDVFSSFPAIRMHPFHDPSWYHAYQHIYAPVLFALMTLSKVLRQDIEVALSGRLYHVDAMCRYGSVANVLRFWCMKVVSMVYMVGLPCYFHGVGKGLILFLIGHFTCGEVLATMFIVNHVIEGVSFATKGGEESVGGTTNEERRPITVEGITPMNQTRADAAFKNLTKTSNKELPSVPLNDWAAVQCQTSVNWSPGSWFWNHFSGGLSHQIEHHLFPSICHTNYVHIQKVVEQTCIEYGVPYQCEPNLWTAYGKMLRHLKTLGIDCSIHKKKQ